MEAGNSSAAGNTWAECRLKRAPSGYDPEAVLMHSGLEAGLAAGFLHENMLHFFEDDAMEDAAAACHCLVDTGT